MDPQPRRTRSKNGSGSAYFLKPTQSWMVSYFGSDGRRKTRKSPTQTERGALAFLTKLQHERDTGESSDRAPTLKAFVETWLDGKRVAGRRPRTLEAYRERLTIHVLPTLGALRLNKITPTHVSRLYAALIDSGLSPTTVASIHAALHNLLLMARRRRLVPIVVTELVEAPSPAPYEARTLSVDEAKHFITSLRDHSYGALFLFLLGTGCRFGEAAGLPWGAVDIDNATAQIRQQVTRERDPRTKRIQYVIAPVKTAAGKRVVHLPPWVVAALRDLCIRSSVFADGKLAPPNPSALVFTSANDTMLRENHVLVIWHNAMKSIGLEGRPGQAPLRMHDLRHSLATLMIGSGEELIAVSQALGHAKLATTADIYVGRSNGATKAAANRYGKLLDPDSAKEKEETGDG